MKIINISVTHRKITGSCGDCVKAWDTLRREGWKVHRPIYWGGRGRSFHAAIEMVKVVANAK